mmetsp:Transcript_32986/g.23821  ORF Transcript_32986/g.23821 Transcript_32986/m.23821 type:complete len:88 (-) Transcript_32986:139-402(-)
MRIGIHTGKIIAGIIGTKVVRYDIFGQDVLIANKVESSGIAGKVCMTQKTHELLSQNSFIMDTLEFEEHELVKVGSIGKEFMTYLVE